MTNTTELEKRLLAALKKAEENEPDGEIVIFTKPQAEALVEVAKWWIALKGAHKVGGLLGSAILWFGGVLVAWVAIKGGLLEWLSNNLGGGS